MNQNCMITREAALEFGLSFQNTYTERPFRDQNWQVVRARENKKIFLWIYERNGYVNLNVKADPDRYERHKQMGELTRRTVKEMGLSLYLENGYSNTVTVIRVPDGIKADDILELMKKDHNIMIAGSFDVLTGQVIRIGHMGENANEADVVETLEALKSVLNKLSA